MSGNLLSSINLLNNLDMDLIHVFKMTIENYHWLVSFSRFFTISSSSSGVAGDKNMLLKTKIISAGVVI